MREQQSEGDDGTSNDRPNSDGPTAEPIDGFRDNATQTAAKMLVEDTIDSEYVADRYSVDETLEALTQPGQRYVLTYLLQSSEPVPLGDLVYYAAAQTDVAVDSEVRKEIAIELTHTALPKLDEFGFVEYDMETQVVESTELTPVVEPFLRVALAQQERAADVRDR
jgi:hypothetical protein